MGAGNPVFEDAAVRALERLWAMRSPLNLLGSSLDMVRGEWIDGSGGIGASSDSFYEYLLKAYILFGARLAAQPELPQAVREGVPFFPKATSLHSAAKAGRGLAHGKLGFCNRVRKGSSGLVTARGALHRWTRTFSLKPSPVGLLGKTRLLFTVRIPADSSARLWAHTVSSLVFTCIFAVAIAWLAADILVQRVPLSV